MSVDPGKQYADYIRKVHEETPELRLRLHLNTEPLLGGCWEVFVWFLHDTPSKFFYGDDALAVLREAAHWGQCKVQESDLQWEGILRG